MSLLARSGSVAPRILASLIVLLGIVMVARTIAAGGGALSVGVVLGVAFVAVGLGRLYLALRASR
jgi:hypothetical protein